MYHSNIQIVPDYHNPINHTHTYKLRVTAIGGQAVIGRIPRNVAEYWNRFDRGELATLLIDNDRNISRTLGGRLIDPSFTAKGWEDVCDVVDLDGPCLEWEPYYAITGTDDSLIFENDVDSENSSLDCLVDEQRALSDDSSYFIGRTESMTTHKYEIISSHPFDPSLLKLKFSWFLSVRILDSVVYDGRRIQPVSLCAHRWGTSMAGIVINY